MVYETINSQTEILKTQLSEQYAIEPAGTTMCLVERRDFSKGLKEQLKLTLYPIGGTIERKRVLADRISFEAGQLINLPKHVAEGVKELDRSEGLSLMGTLERLGVWKLPHSQKQVHANEVTYIAITDGCKSHAIAIHAPNGIYAKLLDKLFNTVFLPILSL